MTDSNQRIVQDGEGNSKTVWNVTSWTILIFGAIYIPTILYVNGYTRFFWDHSEWFFELVTVAFMVLSVLMTISIRRLILNSPKLQTTDPGRKSKLGIMIGITFLLIASAISVYIFGNVGYLISVGGFMMITYVVMMSGFITLFIAIISIFLSVVATGVFFEAIGKKKRGLSVLIVVIEILIIIFGGYIFGITQAGEPSLPAESIDMTGVIK